MFSNLIVYTGKENYDNQIKYGEETFKELEEINKTGFVFRGIQHKIHVLCCCDWKAGACIEGY